MKVLVVDDNADIRFLLATVLRREGYEVDEAPGGREALENLRLGARPALVILDVQMPEIDGWDTLAAIRAEPIAGDVPVILCTVKGSVEDRLRGWELACDAYVSKPFNVEALQAEVRAVVARGDRDRRAVRAAGVAAARHELTAMAREARI